jgi:hypothetical protein
MERRAFDCKIKKKEKGGGVTRCICDYFPGYLQSLSS